MEASPAAAMPSLERRLCDQFEYYFNDANLRRDKHLRSMVGEGDMRGWAPLCEVLTFSRAKGLLDAGLGGAGPARAGG